MEETLQKQKNILEYLFNHTDNPHKEFLIPKKNILTLNLPTVYDSRDETYKFFKGERPSDVFLDCNLDFKSISKTKFNPSKKFKKEDITPEFLKYFKDQYEKLINYYNTDKTIVSPRSRNEEHIGDKNTVMSSKHGDMKIFLFEGFNYNTDFNDSERKEFTELMNFYDSLWEKREEIYKKKEEDYKKKEDDYLRFKTDCDKLSEKITVHDRVKLIDLKHEKLEGETYIKQIRHIKTQEDTEKIWIKKPIFKYTAEYIRKSYKLREREIDRWDTLYKLDNELRHGIVEKLGYFSENSGYGKANEFFKIRLEQLKELKNSTSCHNNKQYINHEIYKLQQFPYVSSALNRNIKTLETPRLKEKIKNIVIDQCNSTQYAPHEETIEHTPIENPAELLYEFVDLENKDNPKPLPINKRQFIYGFGRDIQEYTKLKKYFRTFVMDDAPINCTKNLVYYSQFFNKLLTFCATHSELLFPMRFILKNPFSKKRSLNKISSAIDPIMLLKYKFIGEITFTRREGLKDISYGFLLLKNIDGEKIDYHYIKGVYSHFSFIDVRLQQSDINTIFPLKNITWDEFNMVYKWLKKPIYYYKDDLRTELVHFFVHNTKYQIPPELASKIERVKDDIYAEFNITYKDFYNKTNTLYLLKNTDIDTLFPVLQGGLQIALTGGLKLYKATYISHYLIKNVKLYLYYEDLFKKYEKYLIFNIEEVFSLFNPYILINNSNFLTNLNNKTFDISLNIDDKINIRYYESLFLFNLINKNNMDILEINNYRNFSIYNALYIAKKKKISINCNTHLFPIYHFESIKPSSYFNNINTSNKIEIFNNYIDKDVLKKVDKKYDLICCNIGSYLLGELFLSIEEQSLNIKFMFIIYSLLRLNKNANLLISYGDISTKQSLQIINNLTPYFDDIIVYDQETKLKYKQTGTDVICLKFKDNFNINKFKNIIDKIFILDNTLGNKFFEINKEFKYSTFNENINIYLEDYSVYKESNKDLLNQIKKINFTKHFLILKIYYDVIMTIKKYANTDNLYHNITTEFNYIRIICSYKKGIELKVVERTDMIDAYVKELVKKLKKNTIITKNIAIYKKMKSIHINETLNIEKLNVIKDFYYFIQESHKNKEKNNDTNIFDLIDFNKYKSKIYSLLEKNKDLYISFNDDDLYNFDIIHKKNEEYKMTSENKNFIDNVLIKLFNEIIDHIYEKQNINYYLDLYNL